MEDGSEALKPKWQLVLPMFGFRCPHPLKDLR